MAKDEEKKNKGGRPKEDIIKKYDIDLKRLEKIAAYGITDAQIADLYGVSAASVCDWKKTNAKFSEAIKRGSEKANSAVVKSLFKRALGYSYNETTHEKIKFGNSDDDDSPEIKVKVVRKQIHPDTTACIFWLKNRRGEDWRDVREQKHSGFITDNPLDATRRQLESNPELKEQLKDEFTD